MWRHVTPSNNLCYIWTYLYWLLHHISRCGSLSDTGQVPPRQILRWPLFESHGTSSLTPVFCDSSSMGEEEDCSRQQPYCHFTSLFLVPHATISRFFRTLINNCRVFVLPFVYQSRLAQSLLFSLWFTTKRHLWQYLGFSTQLGWRNGVVCSSHEPSLCSLDHKRRSTLFKFRNTGMLSANTLIFSNILESI